MLLKTNIINSRPICIKSWRLAKCYRRALWPCLENRRSVILPDGVCVDLCSYSMRCNLFGQKHVFKSGENWSHLLTASLLLSGQRLSAVDVSHEILGDIWHVVSFTKRVIAFTGLIFHLRGWTLASFILKRCKRKKQVLMRTFLKNILFWLLLIVMFMGRLVKVGNLIYKC